MIESHQAAAAAVAAGFWFKMIINDQRCKHTNLSNNQILIYMENEHISIVVVSLFCINHSRFVEF